MAIATNNQNQIPLQLSDNELDEYLARYYKTVDDLKEIVDEGLKSRQQEAIKADEIIVEAVENWEQDLRSQGAVSWLRMYREQSEGLRDAELEKAMRQLENGGHNIGYPGERVYYATF